MMGEGTAHLIRIDYEAVGIKEQNLWEDTN